MKITDILRTASSNMFKSKARTILTIIAIFIGAFTLTLTNGMGSGIATYIDEQVGSIGAEDMFIIQGKGADPFGDSEGPQKYDENVSVTTAGGFPMVVLNQKDLEIIRAEPGILSADLDFNVAPDYITGPSGEKYTVMAGSFYDGINLILTAGKAPDNKASDNQVILPSGFTTPLGFGNDQDAVGKTINIAIKNPSGVRKEVTATISGVQGKSLMSEGGAQFNRTLMLALYDIQTEGLPDALKQQQPIATARYDTSLSEEKIDELKKSLDEKGYGAITIQDQIGIFKQVIDAIIMVLNFFAGIALLAASFGIVNTLLMAVQERTKEIGLMKALGMSSKKIFLLFSSEAILLGFWGSLLGSLAGIGVGKLVNTVASKTFLKDLVGFELTSFPFTSVLVIMFVIMTIAFLAGTLPARRASKKDPIEALRYE